MTARGPSAGGGQAMTRAAAPVLALAAAFAAAPALAQSAAAPAPPPTIYLMDQLVTGPVPGPVLQQMEPLHTLDAVEALLKANKIEFVWREVEITSTQIAPEVLRQLAAVPPHEVFIGPQGQGWIMSVILSSRPAPPPPPPEVVTHSPPPRPAPKTRR
jgi:hypothetical protein